MNGTITHDDMKYAEFDEDERAKLALVVGDLLVIQSNGSVGIVGRTALVRLDAALLASSGPRRWLPGS